MGFSMWANGQLQGKNASLKVASHPWPMTSSEKEDSEIGAQILVCILITVGFCFIPVAIVYYLVREKQEGTRHLQTVGGINAWTYYGSHFFWDFLMFLPPALALLGLVMAFDVDALARYPDALFTLVLLYGISVIPYSFATAHLFKDYSQATTVSLGANIFCGVVISTGSCALELYRAGTDVSYYTKYIMMLSPPYCLGFGLLELVMKGVNQNYQPDDGAGIHLRKLRFLASSYQFGLPIMQRSLVSTV